MKLLTTVLAAAVLLMSASAQIFVQGDGDDSGPGTYAQPFATLERAQAEVRALRSVYPDRGVVVMLRRGIYRLDQPLIFGPQDGGDDSHEVVWCTMPREHVVVTGGRIVDDWTVEEDGLFRAALPDDLARMSVREIYFSSRRLTRARFPNEGWLRVDKAGEDRRTSFNFKSGAVPEIVIAGADAEASSNSSTAPNPDSAPNSAATSNPTIGLEVHLLHDWSTSRIPVVGINSAAGTLRTRTPIGCAAPYFAIDNFEAHPRFLLEGHRALIDEPGEWCQDPLTGDLFVKAPPMLLEDPSWSPSADSFQIEVPALERLMLICGELENPVKNLHFVGIQFRHAAFTPPKDGWAGVQASMHERRDGNAESGQRIFVPAAIQMENAVHCSMKECSIRQVGGTAVWIGSGCQDVTLQRSYLSQIGANAINIGDDGARQVDGKPWWKSRGPNDPQLTQRISIQGCRISEAGQTYPGSVGIWVGFAADCTVAYNDINQLPYTGISLGWIWSQDPSPIGGHLIANNDIKQVMELLSDGGCIYTLGRQPGTVIRNNHLHSLKPQAGRAPSNGIFMDEGTCEILVEANRIDEMEQAPIRFHRAGANRIVGNVLITTREDPFQYNRSNPKDMDFVDNSVHSQLTSDDLKVANQVGVRWFIWSQIQAKKND